MKRVRILNYHPGNTLKIAKLLVHSTNYRLNDCSRIIDCMNTEFYEKYKEEYKEEIIKPEEKCDILVKDECIDEFLEKMSEYGRKCILIDDEDPTFEPYEKTLSHWEQPREYRHPQIDHTFIVRYISPFEIEIDGVYLHQKDCEWLVVAANQGGEQTVKLNELSLPILQHVLKVKNDEKQKKSRRNIFNFFRKRNEK